MAETLLAFKAGRAFRRENSNIVEPTATKGAILLQNGDDELLHFLWKNRETGQVEEDLILFPTDASFVKVKESPSGRVYLLKFSSSNQRHFFWMQDASSARDEEFARNLDGYLQDPDFDAAWSSSDAHASGSLTSTSQPSTSAAGFQATPEQIAQLSALLTSVAGDHTPAPPELSLTDILTPANLTPLFTSHPALIPALFPHLPPDLLVPPTPDVLRQIISSPHFRAAVTNFDQALRTGLLGGLVRQLGLPEEAGTGVEPFLRAIQEQADREQEDENNMQTD